MTDLDNSPLVKFSLVQLALALALVLVAPALSLGMVEGRDGLAIVVMRLKGGGGLEIGRIRDWEAVDEDECACVCRKERGRSGDGGSLYLAFGPPAA